jgi:chromosome segregation ATPase
MLQMVYLRQKYLCDLLTCYIFISSSLSLILLSEKDLESLGWNDLVAQKRQLTGELKELSDKVIDIDRNQFRSIGNSIKEQRSLLDAHTDRLKQIRSEVDSRNSQLLSVSEKLSQSRNFLSLMEARLPSEKEEDLQAIVRKNQDIIDAKDYKSEREKNEILSRIKDATMKLEAIKATRTIREQFSQLNQESANINNAIKQLNEERNALRSKISEINALLDNLYDSKRKLNSEHQSRR